MDEQWFDDEKYPALVGKDAMRNEGRIGALSKETNRTPDAERAQTQRKLDCIVDAIRSGLPKGQHRGWDVQTTTGLKRGYKSYTTGGRVVRIAEDDVNHPNGVRAAAFVVAHEMAHNVAQHPNRLLSRAFIKGLGETQARKTLATTHPNDMWRAKLDARVPAYQGDPAINKEMEHEADAGAMHILSRAGLPLDGGPKFFQHALEAYGTESGPNHPPSDVRQTRTQAQAKDLEKKRLFPAWNAARLDACEEPAKKRGFFATLKGWLTGKSARDGAARQHTDTGEAQAQNRSEPQRNGTLGLDTKAPPTLGREAIAHTRRQANGAALGHEHTRAPVRAARELDFER